MLLAVSIADSSVADGTEHSCNVLATEGTFMRLREHITDLSDFHFKLLEINFKKIVRSQVLAFGIRCHLLVRFRLPYFIVSLRLFGSAILIAMTLVNRVLLLLISCSQL
jgi:hypothetical protein